MIIQSISKPDIIGGFKSSFDKTKNLVKDYFDKCKLMMNSIFFHKDLAVGVDTDLFKLETK